MFSAACEFQDLAIIKSDLNKLARAERLIL
jgi:hypothetical protein